MYSGQGMSRQRSGGNFSVPQCALESWKHTGVVLSVSGVSWKINAIQTKPQGQFFCSASSSLVSQLLPVMAGVQSPGLHLIRRFLGGVKTNIVL